MKKYTDKELKEAEIIEEMTGNAYREIDQIINRYADIIYKSPDISGMAMHYLVENLVVGLLICIGKNLKNKSNFNGKLAQIMAYTSKRFEKEMT